MINIINKALYVLFKIYQRKKNGFEAKYYNDLFVKKLSYFGKGSNFKGKSEIIFPNGCTIGRNVHLGKGLHMDCRGGITIGDHTHISRNVTIYSSNHNYEGDRIPYDSNLLLKSTLIGKGVWIGMNASILPGVSIGDGAIIGLGAIISKDVQPFEIVVSGSQRVIGKRDAKKFKNHLENQHFGGRAGKLLDTFNNFQPYSNFFKEKNKLKILCSFSPNHTKDLKLKSITEDSKLISKITFQKELSIIVANHFYGLIDNNFATELIRNLYLSQSILSNPKSIYVISDLVIPIIFNYLSVFPRADYILFIQNPKEFIEQNLKNKTFKVPDIQNNKLVTESTFQANNRYFLVDQTLMQSNYEENLLLHWWMIIDKIIKFSEYSNAVQISVEDKVYNIKDSNLSDMVNSPNLSKTDLEQAISFYNSISK